MSCDELSRRDVLEASWGVAAAVGSAGCTGGDADSTTPTSTAAATDIETEADRETETETTTEEKPKATIEVSDQSGNGTEVFIKEASAEVDYHVVIRYNNGESVSSAPRTGDTTVTDLDVNLDPILGGTTELRVAVHSEETGTELAGKDITYEVTEPYFVVRNQSGIGNTVFVRAANATVDSYVDVHFDGANSRTDTIPADEARENLSVDLDVDKSVNTSTEMRVALHESETGTEIDSRRIWYAKMPGVIAFSQSGDGSSILVEEAFATDPFYVTVHYNGRSVSSDTFNGGTTVTDLAVTLPKTLESETEVRVAIRRAEDRKELDARDINYYPE